MVREMRTAADRGFDFETSGLRYLNGQHPIGYSIGYLTESGSPRVWYVPVAHRTPEKMADANSARRAFGDALAGASSLVAHNGKFDLNMARAHGYAIDPDVQLHDTMIQAYLIYESRRFKLETLAEAEGVCEWLPWDDPWEMANMVDAYCRDRAKAHRLTYKKSDKRTGQRSYMDTFGHAEVPVAIEAEYSCRDIGHTLWLDRVQRSRAQGDGTAYADRARHLYWNEMMLVRALADMEYRGQPVDKQYLLDLDTEVDGMLATMGRDLTSAFGAAVNWRNDNAVREYLYGSLGLPVVKETKTGQPAVDRSALLQLSHHHPAIKDLAEFSVWLKVWQTYTVGLAWWVDADGRVHPSFKQTGTKTGRLSGANPNFQNIPQRHKAASRRIRQAFVVDEGMARVYADYSQIELRILAWATGSHNLLSAYHSPAYDALVRGEIDYNLYRLERAKEPSVDVHGRQAQRTFGARPEDADFKLKRSAAKIINFGVPYGMGPHGLTTNPALLLDRATAEDYFARYHAGNPEIAECKERLFRKMLNERVPHFVNWAGRTCHSRPLRSRNRDTRSEAERSVFATLIQGSAGELTRFSIVASYLAQRAGRLPAAATSTVHDEIQYDCRVSDVPAVGLEVQRIMEDFTGLFGGTPIVCDLEATTTTWADKQEIEP
jgi:DNA polymerase I-like protein with 3'-5' exonuclease and polymerase domains